ncbi:MAG: hypothetical protein NTX64_07960 [Elusimicrobia bacterium]|nr:hypothetical protein [Elusimicrobiota bacterium]
MRERAELREPAAAVAGPPSLEFRLSEYQASRYRFLALGFPAACLAALVCALGLASLEIVPAAACAAVGGFAAVLAGRMFWLKAGRPFARTSRHGLALDEGFLFTRTIPWREIYAIEEFDTHGARLKLSGLRTKPLALTMLEREHRHAFIESVRRWIYTSH